MPEIKNKSQEALFRGAYAIRKGLLKRNEKNASFFDKAKRISDSKIPDAELQTTAHLTNKEIPAKITINKKGKVTKRKVSENTYIPDFEDFLNEFLGFGFGKKKYAAQDVTIAQKTKIDKIYNILETKLKLHLESNVQQLDKYNEFAFVMCNFAIDYFYLSKGKKWHSNKMEDVQKALDDFKNILKTKYKLDIDKEMGYTVTLGG